MNAFRILSPNIIILRGIKEKSIPYSKTFNHMKVAIMFECEKDAVYNIRRHTFPHLEKLVLLNIHDFYAESRARAAIIPQPVLYDEFYRIYHRQREGARETHLRCQWKVLQILSVFFTDGVNCMSNK